MSKQKSTKRKKRALRKALEAFVKDTKRFRKAIEDSTRARFGGGYYTVELLPSGQFRTNWSGSIGNKYVSPGVILDIPSLPDEVEGGDEWAEALDFYADEYADRLREKLEYWLEGQQD